MRYRHFIAAIIALFVATSCYVDDMDQTVNSSADRNEITVVGRVARFEDRVVDTRGTKNDAEAMVTCMAVAIFPIVDGVIGDCVFYDFREGNQLLFTINRQETKNSSYIYNTNSPYVMYVFANLPTMTEDTCATMTLAQMKAMAYSVENVGVPTDGFPMIGSLGDTITPEGDGKTFILKPGADANPTLPTVNGEPTDLLNVPMKSLFAKVNFTIKVTPDQTVDIHLTPQFKLTNYTVHNVPASVDFAKGGGDRLSHDVIDDIASVIGPFENPMPLMNDINIARGTQTINFTFYLPERYLTPTYQSHDGSKDDQPGYYNYPFPVVSGKYRDEDLDLRQRFKPLLPEDQAATSVTINGIFRDHQQHDFNVTYNIYLGDDNYGNFDTERNCEYYHYVTIRGILNSDNQVDYDPDTQMPVAIDHRVNVNRVEPIIINLRRETQLDSHFEIRPLRIRKNPEYTGDLSKAKVKVEVVYAKTPTQKWIGLERSFGNGVQSSPSPYLVTTDLPAGRESSLGKRKYFTYDLTYNTLAGESQKDANGYSTSGGQSVIVPITETDEAVWIYVDEALVAEAGDALRTATIRVSVAEDGTNYGSPIDYIIQQRQLFPVTYGDYTYLIEYEEEYLHNFDASDSYGQTDYEGMQWGLDGIQLSYDHLAISFNQILADTFTNDRKAFYDYYVSKHDSSASGTMHNRVGFDFNTEIIQVVNGYGNHDTDTSNNIDILHLGQEPRSAIEYCYNKNKRNADGHVAWQNTDGTNDQTQLNWYLPAIDQIEDIVMSEYGDGQKTYSRFLDFQAKPYWSSQPSYIRNYAWYNGTITQFFGAVHGAYYVDDTTHARTTSVSYSNNEYQTTPSGVVPDTYYSFWYFYQRILSGKTDETYYEGSHQYSNMDKAITPGPVQREAGNKSRTSYARVRCVRNVTATN